jgi:hypothetical protein
MLSHKHRGMVELAICANACFGDLSKNWNIPLTPLINQNIKYHQEKYGPN